jgi:hypothetical protein
VPGSEHNASDLPAIGQYDMALCAGAMRKSKRMRTGGVSI